MEMKNVAPETPPVENQAPHCAVDYPRKPCPPLWPFASAADAEDPHCVSDSANTHRTTSTATDINLLETWPDSSQVSLTLAKRISLSLSSSSCLFFFKLSTSPKKRSWERTSLVLSCRMSPCFRAQRRKPTTCYFCFHSFHCRCQLTMIKS